MNREFVARSVEYLNVCYIRATDQMKARTFATGQQKWLVNVSQSIMITTEKCIVRTYLP